jgi:hypothetical protein
MPRPKKVIRSIEKTICLPEDLVMQVDIKLFSDLEGRVPFAGWQKYLEKLIRADLEGDRHG